MPGDRKHHTDKFRRCVEQVVAKGHEEDSAYAICTTSLQNAGEAIFEAASAGSEEEVQILAEWDESAHPRDDDGQFAGSDGKSGGANRSKILNKLRDQNPAAVRKFLDTRKNVSLDHVKEEFRAWMRGEYGSHDFAEKDFELDDYAHTMGRSVPNSPSRVPEGIAVKKEGLGVRRSRRYAEEHGESRVLHLLGATGTVRRETLNDRSYLVVPIVALMQGVIHAVNAETPEYVPGEVLEKAAKSWIGKPVTLGHPAKDGRQCSASDALIRKASGIGMIMKSEYKNLRLDQEAWIDEEKAKKLHPRMFENLASGGTEEVSVGAHVVTNSIGSSYNGKLYKGTWLEASGDHLAFLPGGRGACSCEMGCGTFRAAMHLVTDEEIQSMTADTIRTLAEKSLDEMFETVERWQAAAKKRKDCPMCQGAGNKNGNPCEVCSGKGYLKAAGGKGSGNFGHSGRPGQVGGSSSEGGGGKSGDFATKEAAKASRPYGAEVLKGRGTQKQIKGFLDDMEEGENDLRDWGKRELRDEFEIWKSENADMEERLRGEGKTLPGEFATKKEAEASRPWGAAKLEGQGTPKQIKGFIDDMVEGENDLRNWSTQELRDEFENWKAENSDGPDLPGMKKVDHWVNGVRVPTYEKKNLRGAEDRIKHEGGKYVLYSNDGYRKLAEHLSRHAAEKHLEAIQRILASK